MTLTSPPEVRVQMVIRRPVAEVFQAFIDPAITCKFWFTRSSGKLEVGKKLTWEWEMYGVSTPVEVLAIEPDERILIRWDEPPTDVEWRFQQRPDATTLVRIKHSGFTGTDDEKVTGALDSQSGFSFVLAGLKALLEHGVRLELVSDLAPEAHVTAS